MKTLFLLRHAKSSWKDDSLPDFKRPLKRRGGRAATTVGKYLKTKIEAPELVLCSTAVRARDTVDLLIKATKWTTEVRYDQRIYDASGMRLAEVISQIDNDRKTAMLIGHNPGLEELLLLLTSATETLPTATVAKVTLKTTKWSNAIDKRATVEWFIRPRDIENE